MILEPMRMNTIGKDRIEWISEAIPSATICRSTHHSVESEGSLIILNSAAMASLYRLSSRAEANSHVVLWDTPTTPHSYNCLLSTCPCSLFAYSAPVCISLILSFAPDSCSSL